MDIGWPEIAIIAVVVLVLFGSKKMPDAARSLGRSMRILKSEVKGMHDDEKPASVTQPAVLPPAAQTPPVVAPTPTPATATDPAQGSAADPAHTP